MLGLPWTYESGGSSRSAAGRRSWPRRGPEWRGLSLDHAAQTRGGATARRGRRTRRHDRCRQHRAVRLAAGRVALHGFNTDVGGVDGCASVRRASDPRHASTCSARARPRRRSSWRWLTPGRGIGDRQRAIPAEGRPLRTLARQLGVDLGHRPVRHAPATRPTLVVSTVPGGADLDFSVPAALAADAVLLDVTYDPWPSAAGRALVRCRRRRASPGWKC